ncbi:dihydrofolate reductase-like [Contarinia nasturtii]|uniref:dihydrofolate reductase-like n=1 Tax=Contarinia nasturtii TaxID=265458 RepID=UPI0012D48CB8|nr:dihydrofolate reductase-like [Contarinia nasturtii]XP_031639105.1 dihydrofolate reductase-like [Contarinia nasturtii]
MVQNKFNLIVAACENSGIGFKDKLPWSLKNELKHFRKMTTSTADPMKKNAVIMGRLTYFAIPESKRPLANRLNIVLSNTTAATDYPHDVILCSSLNEAMTKLIGTDLGANIETIWICGGSRVFNEAMSSDYCHRIYYTDIKAPFECDVFFPNISSAFKIIPNDEGIPTDEQEENGVKYQYKIYEKQQLNNTF